MTWDRHRTADETHIGRHDLALEQRLAGEDCLCIVGDNHQKPVRAHAAHTDGSDLLPGDEACPCRGGIVRDASLVENQGRARPEETDQREEGAVAEKEHVNDGHHLVKDVSGAPKQRRTQNKEQPAEGDEAHLPAAGVKDDVGICGRFFPGGGRPSSVVVHGSHFRGSHFSASVDEDQAIDALMIIERVDLPKFPARGEPRSGLVPV